MLKGEKIQWNILYRPPCLSGLDDHQGPTTYTGHPSCRDVTPTKARQPIRANRLVGTRSLAALKVTFCCDFVEGGEETERGRVERSIRVNPLVGTRCSPRPDNLYGPTPSSGRGAHQGPTAYARGVPRRDTVHTKARHPIQGGCLVGTPSLANTSRNFV